MGSLPSTFRWVTRPGRALGSENPCFRGPAVVIARKPPNSPPPLPARQVRLWHDFWWTMNGTKVAMDRAGTAVEINARKLVLLCDRITLQISGSDRETSGEGPTLLVDDRELKWAELGALFASYEGFFLDITVRDPSEVE
jgi:hypothetical protein